jgi:hypothetical protein
MKYPALEDRRHAQAQEERAREDGRGITGQAMHGLGYIDVLAAPTTIPTHLGVAMPDMCDVVDAILMSTYGAVVIRVKVSQSCADI